MQPPTSYIKELFQGVTTESKLFLKRSRDINAFVSFASVTLVNEKLTSNGPPILRIGKEIFHNIGSIYAENTPRNLQCFFYTEEVINDGDFSNKEKSIISNIRNEIHRNSPLLRSLRMCMENVNFNDLPTYKIIINEKEPISAPSRTYNRPICKEVAAIICGNEDENITNKDRVVTITTRGNQIKCIPATDASYDPLAYVLTHLHGDAGWIIGMKTSSNKNITAMDFYCYRLHFREDANNVIDLESDYIFRGGLLFQQYCCDQWLKIEQQRLNYIRFHQKQIKAELYQGLADAIAADEPEMAGRLTILPSTLIGSPRHNHQNYQDAMAIVRKYGKPDLFITFTCNPEWIEIKEAIGNQSTWERPDIIDRVFHMKLNELIKDILQRQIIGKSIAHIYVIEFQKRGIQYL